jgi:Pilus biogenesis CpaD protein (pilus_cpaD)
MTRSEFASRVRDAVALSVILLMSGCTLSAGDQPPPTATRPCSLWFNYPADRHSNRDSPYLGCANDANLRVMIDRPEDLAQGRPLGPASGEREARAVEAYRQGKVRPLPSSEAATPTLQWPGLTGGSTP